MIEAEMTLRCDSCGQGDNLQVDTITYSFSWAEASFHAGEDWEISSNGEECLCPICKKLKEQKVEK